jgi:hypothetical protein
MRLLAHSREVAAALIFAAALSGCVSRGDYGSGMFEPRPLLMRNIPSGDDPYSQGWRDACQTFTGIVGSGMLKMEPFAYDPERGVYDKEYYKGWRDGITYCTYYTDYDPI